MELNSKVPNKRKALRFFKDDAVIMLELGEELLRVLDEKMM